jgi:hypothetical protein
LQGVDLKGDVGGVMYPVVIGDGIEGAVALAKTCSISSNVLPTIVCSAPSANSGLVS